MGKNLVHSHNPHIRRRDPVHGTGFLVLAGRPCGGEVPGIGVRNIWRHPAYALGRNPAGKLIFQDAGQALRQDFSEGLPQSGRGGSGRYMACLNCGRIRGSCIGRIWSTIPKGAWPTISWRNFWRFIKTVWRDDCCGTQQSHSHLGTRKSAQGISLCAFFMFSVLPLKTRRAAAPPTKRQLAVRAKSRLIGYSSFQEYILRSSLPTASS